MAINAQKLLPPGKLTAGERMAAAYDKKIDDLLNAKIKTKLINVDKFLNTTKKTKQKTQKVKKKNEENKKRKEKEERLEKGKSEGIKALKIPDLPKTGILDSIKNFVGYTFLGYLLSTYGTQTDLLSNTVKVLLSALDTTSKIIVGTFEATSAVIGGAYKFKDDLRKKVNELGGKGAEKQFDRFTNDFKDLINSIMTLGLYQAGKEKPTPQKTNGGVVKKMAPGGRVTSSRRPTPSRQITRVTRKAPPKVFRQTSNPGQSVGGKKEIEKIFANPDDPNTINPLKTLTNTSSSLKKVPFIGALMGAAVDVALGQRPDKRVYSSFGNAIGYLISNAIESQTNLTLNDLTGAILSMANGGVTRGIRSKRTTAEEIGMQIGTMFQQIIEGSVNTAINSIRSETKKAPIPSPGVTGLDGPDVFRGEGPERMWNFFKNKGLSDFAVAGILGNARWESSFNPRAIGEGMGPGGSNAVGLFQWGENARWASLVKWATSQNLDPWNFDTQLKFAWHEMQTSERATVPALQSATSAADAAEKFRSIYERSSHTEQRRKDAAESYYNDYKGKTYILPSAQISLGKAPGSLLLAQSLAESMGLTMTSFNTGSHAKGSLHYQNRAMDFSNGYDTQQQRDFARAIIARFGSSIEQLIYTPLGFGISKGKKVPLSFWGDATNADHYDHVHVAFAKGGLVSRPTRAIIGEKGPEFIFDADTTRSLEGTAPGLLHRLNMAKTKSQVNSILQSYANYEGGGGTTLLMQPIIMEKQVPTPVSFPGNPTNIPNMGVNSNIPALIG